MSSRQKTVKWCNVNLLTLNTGKTKLMQFFTKQQQKIDIQVSISESIIPDTTSIKFLGLLIDNKLRWKAYGNELAKKLNKACYAIRIVKSSVSSKSLTWIYHSYFHSVLRYGILFWGNSPICRDIFRIQKRAIRIITSKGLRESCRELFKELKILTLPSLYIHSVLVFVMENRGLFTPNNDIHDHNTRNNLDFHLPTTHLSIVQRGVMYSGCRVFNGLCTHTHTHKNPLR